MHKILLLIPILASLSCSQEDGDDVVAEATAEEEGGKEEPSRSDVDVAGTQIRQFHAAMDQYRLNNYMYPASLATLTEDDEITGQPILKAIPLDPWGNAYQMKVDLDGQPYILCFGADGREGGDGLNQDISSKTLGL